MRAAGEPGGAGVKDKMTGRVERVIACRVERIIAEGRPGKLSAGNQMHADGSAQEEGTAYERAGECNQEMLTGTRHKRGADKASQRPDVAPS